MVKGGEATNKEKKEEKMKKKEQEKAEKEKEKEKKKTMRGGLFSSKDPDPKNTSSPALVSPLSTNPIPTPANVQAEPLHSPHGPPTPHNNAPAPVPTPPRSNTPPPHNNQPLASPHHSSSAPLSSSTLSISPSHTPSHNVNGSASMDFSPRRNTDIADKNTNLLKSKLAALPEENKICIEYLLTLLAKAVPTHYKPPSHLELPPPEEQVEITLEKLLEAGEILFNKDHHAMLKKYTREMNESPKRRVEKWRLLASMIDHNDDFLETFVSSNTLDAAVRSALAVPLEDDEADDMMKLMHRPLVLEVAHKDLLNILKSCSHSNQYIKSTTDGVKTLPETLVELVCSFKKQKEENAHEELSASRADLPDKDKKEIDVSVGKNLALALLHHANVIRHAKTGSDLSVPLRTFFEEQILFEENRGASLKKQSVTHKEDTEKSLNTMDTDIKTEQGKLETVQAEILDLESRLVQKRAEEKALEELLARQREQREKYKVDQEKSFSEITGQISSNKTQLSCHNKSLECVNKFFTDVSELLESEINSTIHKTRETIVELEKEATFLEEKMASYERSFSLFNADDEPEVLDGLKKLFMRSAAIYAESRQSILRVKTVVGLLHTVLSAQQNVEKELTDVKDVEESLEKVMRRQNALNEKYKLQKS